MAQPSTPPYEQPFQIVITSHFYRKYQSIFYTLKSKPPSYNSPSSTCLYLPVKPRLASITPIHSKRSGGCQAASTRLRYDYQIVQGKMNWNGISINISTRATRYDSLNSYRQKGIQHGTTASSLFAAKSTAQISTKIQNTKRCRTHGDQ